MGILLRQYDRDCFPDIGHHSESFTQYLCGERNLVVADWLGAE